MLILVAIALDASIYGALQIESVPGKLGVLACILVVFGFLFSPFWLRLTCDFLGFPGDASPRRAFRKRDLERLFSRA
jgi:hypothetical protein